MHDKEKTSDVKYATQHLANERTYLAWIRTAIAIIAIGFLITNLHFSTNPNSASGNFLAILLGISTGVFGIVIIIIGTMDYLKKKKQIDQHLFYSSQTHIVFVSSVLIVIAIIALLYVFIQ